MEIISNGKSFRNRKRSYNIYSTSQNEGKRIPIEDIAYQDICLGFSQPIREAAGFAWATGLLAGICLAVRGCFGGYFF
jgi:hypothetical protein